MDEKAILRQTMLDKMTVKRQTVSNGTAETRVIYQDAPCALSRSGLPTAAGHFKAMAESDFSLTLFCPPEVILQNGDQVEVKRQGRLFRGTASDCIPYLSHCTAAFNVREVTACDSDI